MSRKISNIVLNYLLLFGIAGLIIALDQYTKEVVRQNLAVGGRWAPWDWLYPYARILHYYNTGVAFGMFQGMNTIFASLAVIVALAIIYYYPRVAANDWTLRIALCLQLGGALGNLVDRVTQGYVTDFISVGDFAIFNIADSSISIGVAILLLGVWIQERRKKNKPTSLSTNPLETSTIPGNDQSSQ
ncbi:MAG TPA: signal peptidase II [Anaerolineaceae bacterium]